MPRGRNLVAGCSPHVWTWRPFMCLCHGLLLNVVSDMEGAGAAVLIRSCSPISVSSAWQNVKILRESPGRRGKSRRNLNAWLHQLLNI
ncbi:hypothetical protein U9M48_039547 [Paspalum notatum var. saurae]|uniref:Uncharacterized protein n=1 Tax=Paspalum notatum var. saurae TaxID=547442 RepID=A0AAQ3UQH4_PASNO